MDIFCDDRNYNFLKKKKRRRNKLSKQKDRKDKQDKMRTRTYIYDTRILKMNQINIKYFFYHWKSGYEID